MSSIKISLASETRSINSYKNLRTKVTKCGANIYFNRQHLVKKIPNYSRMMTPHNSPTTKNHPKESTSIPSKRINEVYSDFWLLIFVAFSFFLKATAVVTVKSLGRSPKSFIGWCHYSETIFSETLSRSSGTSACSAAFLPLISLIAFSTRL